MTDEEIAAIEARAAGLAGGYAGEAADDYARDVPLLLAAVRELRAVVEGVEWLPTSGGHGEGTIHECPVCRAGYLGPTHKTGCALAAALGRGV